MPKKTMYQVFDSDGRARGLIEAPSPADAMRRVRRSGMDFPMLIGVPEKRARKLKWMMDQKRQFQNFILSWVKEQVKCFEKRTGTTVAELDIHFEKGE